MGKSTKQRLFGLMELPMEHEEQSTDKVSRLLALDPLTFEPRNTYNLCQSNISFLRYEVLGNYGVLVKGGCCLSCFPHLLRKIKHCESDAIGRPGNTK